MSLKEIGRRLKNFLRSPKRKSRDQAHFGWLTLKQKQQALKTETRRKAARVDLQSAQQHKPNPGVRRFRVRDHNPWNKL